MHPYAHILSHIKNLTISRLQEHFQQTPFDFQSYISTFQDLPYLPGQFVEERMAVAIALCPHLSPGFFESAVQQVFPTGADVQILGGARSEHTRSIVPTGETVLFLLAGQNLERRLQIQTLFDNEGYLAKQNILWLDAVKEGDPVMTGRLLLSQEIIEKLLFGREMPPKFSTDFPAKRIATDMDWQDVVLHPNTLSQIQDISIWLKHRDKLNADSNLGRKIKPGYRVLFYGPSGTGKTLTATLLGKEFGKEVYRIDLSQVISKYIGETEKNLQKVFDRAENKDWILFFDEADALFGKRTNVSSAHDKFANQEVSYLLQRVEDFSGLLILASNFKNNLDEAFTRRFHAIVHFPMPSSEERLQLWQKSLPQSLPLAHDVNLDELARKYELSGANIINAVQYAALHSFAKETAEVQLSDLLNGIRREFVKEEKSF